jgi:hypothetical protein
LILFKFEVRRRTGKTPVRGCGEALHVPRSDPLVPALAGVAPVESIAARVTTVVLVVRIATPTISFIVIVVGECVERASRRTDTVGPGLPLTAIEELEDLVEHAKLLSARPRRTRNPGHPPERMSQGLA